MTGSPHDGRIGHLTPEQELRLKEMWAHMLAVSDTLPESGTSTPAASAAGETSRIKGFFKRGKEDPKAPDGSNFNIATVLGNLKQEEMMSAFWDMLRGDNPDNLVLRFLRARKWDVPKAIEMLFNTMRWRLKEFDVEEIFHQGEARAIKDGNDEFLLQLESGKCRIRGKDKKHRPIFTIKPCFHDPKLQGEKAMEEFTIYVIENARLTLKDPVDTATIIFDLSKFSLSNMDYPPIKFMIGCFEAHYPECLGVLLIYKAPFIFQGIWNIIKNWLDPVVAAKINFVRNKEDLNKYIDDHNLEVDMGGKDDYEYKYVKPVDGENDKMKDTETRDKLMVTRKALLEQFKSATLDWIKPVHKTESDEAARAKAAIAVELRKNFWQVDPYVRCRTLYDRIGLIKAD